MRRYLFLFMLCSLFLSCEKNEVPDEVLYEKLAEFNHELTVTVCGCGCDEPIDEFTWRKELEWDYPVKPGMEEWKEFQSTQEMIDACQIPDNILSSLSTENLTDICLQYPLIINVFVFDNMNVGLDAFFDEFNGIRELYKRKEVSKELLKRYYEMMQNVSFLCSAAPDKGNFMIPVSALEVLIKSTIRNNDAINNYKTLLKYLVFGYETKLKYTSYFGYGFQTNYYARAHLIIKISPKSIKKFPNGDNNPIFICDFSSGEAMNETLSVIDELSYQLIE